MRIRVAMTAAVFVFLLACGPVGLAFGQGRVFDHLIELVPSGQAQASQVQAPPRDTRPDARRVGTAVMRGRVVDGVTGQPLPHVRVRLMAGISGGAALETESGGTFEPLVDHATRVTLRDGEPQTVQLRRYKLPSASQ